MSNSNTINRRSANSNYLIWQENDLVGCYVMICFAPVNVTEHCRTIIVWYHQILYQLNGTQNSHIVTLQYARTWRQNLRRLLLQRCVLAVLCNMDERALSREWRGQGANSIFNNKSVKTAISSMTSNAQKVLNSAAKWVFKNYVQMTEIWIFKCFKYSAPTN